MRQPTKRDDAAVAVIAHDHAQGPALDVECGHAEGPADFAARTM